jgi:hypothetical protein
MKSFSLMVIAAFVLCSCAKNKQEPTVDDKGISGQYKFTTASWSKYSGDTANLQVEGESTLSKEFTGTVVYNPATDKVTFRFNQNFPLTYSTFDIPLSSKRELNGDNTFYYNFLDQRGVPGNNYFSNSFSFNVKQVAPFDITIFIATDNYIITGPTLYREKISGVGQKQ